MAMGEATLDVVLQQNLREKAQHMGALLRSLFLQLAEVCIQSPTHPPTHPPTYPQKHPLIGDVRGLGMMIGVELVKDQEAKTSAPEAAAYVLDRTRQLGVHIQVRPFLSSLSYLFIRGGAAPPPPPTHLSIGRWEV